MKPRIPDENMHIFATPVRIHPGGHHLRGIVFHPHLCCAQTQYLEPRFFQSLSAIFNFTFMSPSGEKENNTKWSWNVILTPQLFFPPKADTLGHLVCCSEPGHIPESNVTEFALCGMISLFHSVPLGLITLLCWSFTELWLHWKRTNNRSCDEPPVPG